MPANFTIAEDNRTYDLSGQAGPLMEILQILKANGIGLNNMIDLRSNPAARAQVQAVVRRAAAAQAPAAPAPAAAPAGAPSYAPAPEPTTAQRLQELETLRATGAISDEEYSAKRQQILSDL
jgi:pyruvate/2-oxoglutarate dehydrogenase complex dihydrolipoamide acyltransferase (E2) component